MSMKPQAGGNRKPGGSNSGAAAASGTGGVGGGVGRQNIGRWVPNLQHNGVLIWRTDEREPTGGCGMPALVS